MQTGVSSEGTTLSKRTFPAESARVTGFKSFERTEKPGALSPGFNSGPTAVNGFPKKVTAPGLSCGIGMSSVKKIELEVCC
jgi:hypothetical protein